MNFAILITRAFLETATVPVFAPAVSPILLPALAPDHKLVRKLVNTFTEDMILDEGELGGRSIVYLVDDGDGRA